MKIVIVEDEYRIREGLSNLIKKLFPQHSVAAMAEDGKEGLVNILAIHPDLIFTDIRMPVMDGLKMLENVREAGITARVVILSAYGDFEYAQKAIRLGIKDYLVKPVAVNELIRVMNNMETEMEEELKKKQEAMNEHLLFRAKPCENQACDSKEEEAFLSITVTRAKKMVEERYFSGVTLEEIAQELGLTAEYLSTKFRKETGVNFSTYIRDVRIDHAKKLLVNTSLKQYEIANRVGYSDPKYFGRVFREVMGMSTAEYRNFVRNKQKY